MKQQKDWFTGIDYYDQYKEKEIQVIHTTIKKDIPLHRHIQAELWYVLNGQGDICINGEHFPLEKDTFLCMYPYHLYEASIISSVEVVIIRFYIGVFMHMIWEKHERGKNAQLVYETRPYMKCKEPYIKECIMRLCKEQQEKQFGAKNLILYLTMEIHMLFCRYALSSKNKQTHDEVWKAIQHILCAPASDVSLQDIADKINRNPHYVNQMIKERCGYTLKELTQYGKVINACALLHFEELSISYISDLMNFDSTATFYRVFESYTGMHPLQYRKEHIMDELHIYEHQDLFLKIEQYLYLHFFQAVTIESLAVALDTTPHAISQLLKESYDTSFYQELQRIRIHFAKALLKATDMQITHIALDCGFESMMTFQRAFQKAVGCTPSAYRNLQK